MHAAIHLKELPDGSVRHDEIAINHNYNSGLPSPSPATVNGGGSGGSSAQQGDFEFAGY